MAALLQLSSIEADIGGSRILRGVSLDVSPGEVVCLMGRNGVGKTTTLRAIMGVRPIRAGDIQFDGRSIKRLSTEARARAGIGYVPQGRDIFPHLTVEENLQIGLAVHGRRGAEAKALLDRVYSLFPVLKEMLNRRGGDLSGGQQQQLAIARALAASPKLLILDEPTEGIQPSVIKDIGRVLRLLADRKTMAIVLVEQYYDFAAELADQYIVMERGEVIQRGRGADMERDGARKLVSI